MRDQQRIGRIQMKTDDAVAPALMPETFFHIELSTTRRDLDGPCLFTPGQHRS
jgi:hypothetical protein